MPLRLKCILINPWVYDFAAMSLWSMPLGLIKVAEYMSQFDIDQRLIDCMDVFKAKRHGIGKYRRQVIEKPDVLKAIPRHYARYGIGLDEFKERLKALLPADFVLVTSLMSYWYPGVNKAIDIVRSLSSQTPVILGGIYATLFHGHASDHSGADLIYKGHAGDGIKAGLETFGFRLKRTKMPQPYYRLGLYRGYAFAPLLTSQGCPFRCSYCASAELFEGFHQKEPFSVVNEIKWLYHEHGVRDYAFYDDALLAGADFHIKVILREIVKSGWQVRFHCPNGIHALFIDDELAYLMKASGFRTLRLALETINPERQLNTGGKITYDVLREAVNTLKRHGFGKGQIGVYLMYGLPGQGLSEVKEGVEFLKALGVRINLTEFSPIPGTPCWRDLTDMGIINDAIDPLVTNNSVFSYLFSGYEPHALQKLKLDVKEYNKRGQCPRDIVPFPSRPCLSP